MSQLEEEEVNWLNSRVSPFLPPFLFFSETQVSYVAFTLAGRECPVRNLHKSPKPDLDKLPRITEIAPTSSNVAPAFVGGVVITSETKTDTSPQPKVGSDSNNLLVVLLSFWMDRF